jgi:hypothetical protein
MRRTEKEGRCAEIWNRPARNVMRDLHPKPLLWALLNSFDSHLFRHLCGVIERLL